LRLGVFAADLPNSCFTFFARDIPRLTGARSAPYENFFASFAFFAAILLFFGCGFAALRGLTVLRLLLYFHLGEIAFVIAVIRMEVNHGC
jgi:hypothetical protein